MPARSTEPLRSTTVEFHRFGDSPDVLKHNSTYIRASGYDQPAAEVVSPLDHVQLMDALYELRYPGDGAPANAAARAQKLLGAAAQKFIDGILPADCAGRLVQIDIVTHAAELWAFPFEACYLKDPKRYLESGDCGVAFTRRVRGEFTGSPPQWPIQPSILFVHAKETHDLDRALIDQHRLALEAALEPWGRGEKLYKKKLLAVEEVDSLDALRKLMAKPQTQFAYLHILAHGAPITGRKPSENVGWGLRLGEDGVTLPDEITDVLTKAAHPPLAITLAACDGANQEKSEYGQRSLAQQLHRKGIPVVIGSQFPLTKTGSEVLARQFYRRLASGADVRAALHGARVALFEQRAKHHDWLSLVGYIRLPPEGYADHLAAFALKVELALLKSLQEEADDRLRGSPERSAYDEFERRLNERLQALDAFAGRWLDRSSDLRDEYLGLVGSANKRLAELLHARSTRFDATRDADRAAARTALERAYDAYRRSYSTNLSSHWTGIQKLALEAALNGKIAAPVEIDIVVRAAELARDAPTATPGSIKDYWSCGTIAEAVLVASAAGRAFDFDAGRAALRMLLTRAKEDKSDAGFAAQSTRRQLERYTTWWTAGNGYFAKGKDLAKDAARLIELLPKEGGR